MSAPINITNFSGLENYQGINFLIIFGYPNVRQFVRRDENYKYNKIENVLASAFMRCHTYENSGGGTRPSESVSPRARRLTGVAPFRTPKLMCSAPKLQDVSEIVA